MLIHPLSEDRFSAGLRTGLCRSALLALAAGLLLMGLPSVVFADGGSVRYSYERIEIDGTERWGLVPRGERDKLAGKLTKSKLFEAFKTLKDDKQSTYGDSSIRIKGSLPNRATVTVRIDTAMAKKGYAPIIMAETVYTLTEMGISGVEFPGYFDGAMKREHVPFYAYTLTVPMWRALPPGNLSHAQVRLPDGELVAAAAFYRRWKAKEAALHEALFSYLQHPQSFTVTRVLRLLPELGLDYREQVIPLLAHDSQSVRTRALSVLEAHRDDAEVLVAVLKMMNEDDHDDLARAAAEFLGEATPSQYNIHHELYLLEKGSAEESKKAASALANRAGDERAVDALYEHLRDERTDVAAAAADAIDELGADARQIEALSDKKVADALRLSIAEQLSDKRASNSKRTGLDYIATNSTGRSAELALRKLGQLSGDEARSTVESYLSAETRRKRLTAAEILVERAESASLPAFAKAIAGGKSALELEEAAYRLMAAQSLSLVLEHSEGSNKIIKRLAYRAIGERAVKEGAGSKVFDKLASGANSRDASIRGASARAIGVFASDEALEVLGDLADDKDSAVRAGVAHGLSHFEEGQMFDTLEAYLSDSSPQVVAAALAAMQKRREATKWDRIKELAAAKDPHVRANALSALSQLVSREDPQGVREVISQLSGAVSDGERLVQLTAIEQLSTFNEERATTGIAIQLNAQEANLRVAAVEALGKTGHSSATELVLSVLEDPNADIRRAAILALGELGASSSKPRLEALLEDEDDPELKELIKQTLRKI